MRITVANAEYRPVTIVLETQDQLDQFMWILENVANNVINHPAQIINVARNMKNHLTQVLIDSQTNL